jgi:hypothetical protein
MHIRESIHGPSFRFDAVIHICHLELVREAFTFGDSSLMLSFGVGLRRQSFMWICEGAGTAAQCRNPNNQARPTAPFRASKRPLWLSPADLH